MHNTEAPRSFSTSKPVAAKKWLVLMIGILASMPALTCGPHYDSLRMDMISDLGIEPRKPSYNDVGYLLNQFAFRRYPQPKTPVMQESSDPPENPRHILYDPFTSTGLYLSMFRSTLTLTAPPPKTATQRRNQRSSTARATPVARRHDAETFRQTLNNAFAAAGRPFFIAGNPQVHPALDPRCDQSRYGYSHLRSLLSRAEHSSDKQRRASREPEKKPLAFSYQYHADYLRSARLDGVLQFCASQHRMPADEALSRWQAEEPNLLAATEDPRFQVTALLALIWGSYIHHRTQEARQYLQTLKTLPINHEERHLMSAFEPLLSRDRPPLDTSIKKIEVTYPLRFYSWGRCTSNNHSAYLVFVRAAIADSSVSDEQLMRLINLRLQLMEACGKEEQLTQFTASLEEPTDHYHRYLLAAAHFYSNDHEQARIHFARIADEKSHPLSELSLYLLGRSYLRENQPQENSPHIVESDEEKSRNQAGSLRAVNAFEDYLKAYPNGRYANSARGLIRRAHWQAGNNDIYAGMLQTHIDQRMTQILGTENLGQEEYREINALLGEYQRFVEHDRTNLQALDALLKQVNPENAPQTQTYQSLTALKNHVALYGYYREGRYADVIQALQDQHQHQIPEFILLARALEDSGEWQKVIDLWADTRTNNQAYALSQHASYEIARIRVAHQGIEGLLRDTHFDHPLDWAKEEADRIKANYLASLCDDSQQRIWLSDTDMSLRSRQVILADMATRHLYNENFTELHHLFRQYPDDVLGGFSSIRTAVQQITQQQQLGKAYMNIGFFMQTRITPLVHLPTALHEKATDNDNQPPDIGCSQTTLRGFGGVAGPYYYYTLAMEHFGNEKSTDEAKTLHFITRCFRTDSAYRGACLWGYRNTGQLKHGMIYNMTSEQAFRRLHRKYAGTEWANKTPYHY